MAIIRSTILKIKKSSFIKFLFVGVINTLFGYAVFALLLFWGIDYRGALLIATVCGVLFNFKTTGILVFKKKSNGLVTRFVIVYLLTYLLNIGTLQVVNYLGMSLLMSQAILLLPLALISYFLNKKFVFK